MFNMFEKKTKWVILTAYSSQGDDCIVFVRKGLKSGMLYFKSKNTTLSGKSSYSFSHSMFDTKKILEDLINL